MSGDICVCHNWERAPGNECEEARDAAKHFTKLFWGSWTHFQRVYVEASLYQQEILRHQQGAREFTSTRTLSTWREYQFPQVKGSVRQDHPPLQTPITSPGCYLCFWTTSSNWRFQWPPQLRTLISSPGCHVYFWLSGYNSEVPTTSPWVWLTC